MSSHSTPPPSDFSAFSMSPSIQLLLCCLSPAYDPQGSPLTIGFQAPDVAYNALLYWIPFAFLKLFLMFVIC